MILNVSGLHLQRGEGEQAHRVCLPSLSLAAGEIKAIVGESGCGKSTLLEALGLLLNPRSLETYTLGGCDVAALLRVDDQKTMAALRSRSLGFILQSGGLLPFLNVRENIALPRRMLGLPVDSTQVGKAIQVLKLKPLLDKLPQALSIGERQRVACIRAIAHEPLLLLADEPTAALDPHTAQALFELLLELVAELKLSALLVSHDWALVERFKLPRLVANNNPGETRFAPQA